MNTWIRLFLVGAVAAVMACCGCATREPVTFRVLTYNIHHGEGMDGVIDLDRIAKVIRESNADLVALQEVDRGVERSNREDQPAALAALTDMHAIFEKNIDYQGGEYGNAVLTRLPITFSRNHHLPKSLPNEQRGMLEVHVEIDGSKLIFLATHFDYHADDGERMASVAALRELVERHGATPIVVAGDLNALPDSRVTQKAALFLTDCDESTEVDGFTFPADQPARRIDYLLCNTGSGLSCIARRVLPEGVASDHRPVVAEFQLSR